MNQWSRMWRRLSLQSVQQAWGLAPQQGAGAWALVGLVRQSQDLVKVKTALSLHPPEKEAGIDLAWLSQGLRQSGRTPGGRSRQRLNMALPAVHLHEGYLDFPANLPQEDWVYEVQLEVSQVLQLAPDDISFDFEPVPVTDGLVQRVHWIGCAQAHMTQFKGFARAAGWRLAAVEPEKQAALRGVRVLKGGVSSLLTQAPQDWQFWLPDAVKVPPQHLSVASDSAVEAALRQVLTSPAGPRLVAAGLALKAWQ